MLAGLISLIPILGQVMAARDITANVYAVGARGGFKNATSGQLVNLGFAAFGAIPEVGSVFKTVFKPMWKERQAAKGVVHSGLQAIESMLGMRKGGAIAWIRQELLGKWAALTTQAIAAVNLALDACIDLTQFLATAGGWKSWRIPSSVQNLAAREKGLVGEHMVDFSELKRLGGQWPHDQEKGPWNPESVKKLNVDKRPVNLALHDLPKVTWPGIDAVWLHGGSYTVTEAKASLSIGTVYGMGKAKEKRGSIPVVTGLNPDQQLLHYLLTDSSDKGGAQSPLMQMSVAWVQNRAPGEKMSMEATAALKEGLASRRVVLVTFESQGGLDHAQAWEEIQLGKAASEIHAHEDHGITRVWEGAAIDAVNAARERAHEAKRTEVTQPSATSGTKGKNKSRSGN